MQDTHEALGQSIRVLLERLGPMASRIPPMPVEPDLCAMAVAAPMQRGIRSGRVTGRYLLDFLSRTIDQDLHGPEAVLLRLVLMLETVTASIGRYAEAGYVELGADGEVQFMPDVPIVAAVCPTSKVSGFVQFDAEAFFDAVQRHDQGLLPLSDLMQDALRDAVHVH